VVYPPTGSRPRRGDEHPAYALSGVWPIYLTHRDREVADLTNLVIYIHLCLLSAKVSAITCSVVWNSPPTDLRVLSLSAATFAKHLKTYLFSRLVCLLLHPCCGLFSRTTCVSWYHKGKTSLDLKEARDDGFWDGSGISWTICKQSNKGKTSLDLTEARYDGFWDGSGISWTICKQSAPYCRQTTTPAPHHSIFTGRMLFYVQPTVSMCWRHALFVLCYLNTHVTTIIILYVCCLCVSVYLFLCVHSWVRSEWSWVSSWMTCCRLISTNWFNRPATTKWMPYDTVPP